MLDAVQMWSRKSVSKRSYGQSIKLVSVWVEEDGKVQENKAIMVRMAFTVQYML